MEAWKGVKSHIQKILEVGTLKEYQSPWNMPFLLVWKPGTNEYRPVQDLRAVNSIVTTLHLRVPMPSFAFLCLQGPKKYLLSSWRNLRGDVQLTWTRLPQRFKNSLTIFGEALCGDLIPLLLATEIFELSQEGRKKLQGLLQEKGIRF